MVVGDVYLYVGGRYRLVDAVVIFQQEKRRRAVWLGERRPLRYHEVYRDTATEVAYLDKINMMCAVYPENYTEKPAGNKEETPNVEETSEEESNSEERSAEEGEQSAQEQQETEK